jgi:hypothetical protein
MSSLIKMSAINMVVRTRPNDYVWVWIHTHNPNHQKNKHQTQTQNIWVLKKLEKISSLKYGMFFKLPDNFFLFELKSLYQYRI